MKIISMNGEVKYYKQEEGVTVGDEFIPREKFKEYFKELLKKSDIYDEMRDKLRRLLYTVELMRGPHGVIGVAQYQEQIDAIVREFSNFMGGLGGKISLLTTFSFGKRSQRTYYLEDIDELPSKKDLAGKMKYENTRKAAINLQEYGKKINLLEKALKHHLTQFSNQIQSTEYEEDDFIKLKIWAHKNLKSRYKEFENVHSGEVSYSDYFWGKGQVQGFIGESYGTHLSLVHPNELMGNHISQLKKSVISEHGGYGSSGLFELLKSSKGNVGALVGGDIIVVDPQGTIQFNIQSKVSTKTKYEFEIAYKDFMRKMEIFFQIYDTYKNNPDKIAEEDANILFNTFKSVAWVEVKEELEQHMDEEKDKIITQYLTK